MTAPPVPPVLPTWSVHLPTVDRTCVRLALRPRSAGDPWPFTLALSALSRLGASAPEGERFRSLGAGRGVPLLASQELTWQGCALHLEAATHRDGSGEVVLELPPWDELTASAASEAELWELVDAVATAVDAVHGTVGDGEAQLVTTAAAQGDQGWLAADYRELPLSGLHVLLR